MGRDVIHVHHVRPESTLGPNYRVDPIKDLRPLCPNCHAIVHCEEPPMAPETLKERLGQR
jgi:5-methylcytosine-specific restriction protein A